MTLSPPGFKAPIFVTGMPRSGTTFMQHLLSSHERITIYGQEPRAAAWGDWLATLLEGISFASDSNSELAYTEPHYAGETACREATANAFLRVIFDYMTGGEYSPRWGLKSLTQCRAVTDSILGLCPNARWVVCIRDPFRSIESMRNTFDAAHNVPTEQLMNWWCDAAEFAVNSTQAIAVHIDQLSTSPRRLEFAQQLFEFIGEETDDAVKSFVQRWPVVHEVVSHSERSFQLTDAERQHLLASCERFRHWAAMFGYCERVQTTG